MKLVVLGAGAIGAYVGAALTRGGTDVTLVARGAHLDAMRSDGVHVSSPNGDFVAHPKVTSDIDAVGDADIVFVALKAHSLPEIAPRLGQMLASGAATVWAQNGIPWWYFQSLEGPFANWSLESVDPVGVIAASIPSKSVIGCVAYCSTEIVAPGRIRHVEGVRFTLGEPDGTVSDRCHVISEAFACGGLKAPIDKKLRNQIWLKLVGNAAFNPMSALTRATLSELGERTDVMEVLRELFRECALVADCLDVEFPLSLERRLGAGIAVGDHRTSMLQDLENGRVLELDCMTGALIELAGRLGIEVPHLRTVHACTKLLDQLSRRDSR